jgi:two-component system phosphate regulon sensor histidine kinase PhoR
MLWGRPTFNEVPPMVRPPVPMRLLVPVVAALAAPVAVVFVVLVAAGKLGGGLAVVAWAAAVAALALLARFYLADILALRSYAEELLHRDDVAPPRLTFGSAPAEVFAALTRLHRTWTDARRTLRSGVAANQTILDRLPDPLILFDRDRQVVRGNRAAHELFGERIAGRDLSAVVRNPDVLDAADAVLKGEESEAAVEFALPVPVERDYLAGIISLPTPAADGTVAILRLHDLSDIKRTEQMRADFVANVSHELKTPLTTLIGYIETLRGAARGDEEARARFLSVMESQAARMNNLVDDLLSLSRIQLEEHMPPTGRVGLADVLGATSDALAETAKARGQTIALDIPDDVPVVIGDRHELIQVFQNLIDNAVKYGAENSTIRVAATRAAPAAGMALRPGDAGVVAVAVADEGEGIARQHLPRLTERFYRVDPARSRELGGTGLGLAIVKHIVHRHRGELRVESALGKGTTFTVYLPAAGEQAPAEKAGAA